MDMELQNHQLFAASQLSPESVALFANHIWHIPV